jgi:hypothetical protein
MATDERRKHLRKFGLVMSVPLLVLAGFLFYKGRPAAPYFLVPGLLFLGTGLLWPALLGPVERGWMWFALKLQIVTTTIILSLAYYLLITPIALVGRIRGRDALKLKRRESDTYWIDSDQDGSASRPYKPY